MVFVPFMRQAELIKAAPLRSAAPGHARTGLRPWGADPVRRAGQPRQHPLIKGNARGEPPQGKPAPN